MYSYLKFDPCPSGLKVLQTPVSKITTSTNEITLRRFGPVITTNMVVVMVMVIRRRLRRVHLTS